jgi:uncharacterized protein YbjT (DUF2867 family)
MFANMAKQRILALPARVAIAPVDSDEFAVVIAGCVGDGLRGLRQDFIGPETLTMPELMQQFLAARGLDRRIRKAPLPSRVQAP